ncbi:MAG: hypothetical protein RXQ62_07070, partial [Nitrososphaeria archaeon]
MSSRVPVDAGTPYISLSASTVDEWQTLALALSTFGVPTMARAVLTRARASSLVTLPEIAKCTPSGSDPASSRATISRASLQPTVLGRPRFPPLTIGAMSLPRYMASCTVRLLMHGDPPLTGSDGSGPVDEARLPRTSKRSLQASPQYGHVPREATRAFALKIFISLRRTYMINLHESSAAPGAPGGVQRLVAHAVHDPDERVLPG